MGTLIAVSAVSIVALIGFFRTKAPGFGPFTVGAFVLLVAISLTAILASAGKPAADDTTSILLAVIGFAGGLISAERMQDKRN